MRPLPRIYERKLTFSCYQLGAQGLAYFPSRLDEFSRKHNVARFKKWLATLSFKRDMNSGPLDESLMCVPPLRPPTPIPSALPPLVVQYVLVRHPFRASRCYTLRRQDVTAKALWPNLGLLRAGNENGQSQKPWSSTSFWQKILFDCTVKKPTDDSFTAHRKLTQIFKFIDFIRSTWTETAANILIIFCHNLTLCCPHQHVWFINGWALTERQTLWIAIEDNATRKQFAVLLSS